MSNLDKHTPGPWRFYTEPQPNGCPIVGNERGLMVAMLAHSIHYQDQRSEAFANARLIAAAPELLDALVTLCKLALSGEPVIFTAEYDKARTAITKATGGTA